MSNEDQDPVPPELRKRFKKVMMELFDLLSGEEKEVAQNLWGDANRSTCIMFRLLGLSPAELENFQDSLSDEERQKIDEASEDKRDKLIQDMARTRYFRQCAWMKYLEGDTDEKPFEAPEAEL